MHWILIIRNFDRMGNVHGSLKIHFKIPRFATAISSAPCFKVLPLKEACTTNLGLRNFRSLST